MSSTELAARLAGRYTFVRELGQGATGRVLLVADAASGGEARAAKVVAPAQAARLAWEFELLSRIAHPNVARVFELLRVSQSVAEPFRLAPGDTVLIEQFAQGEPADRVADRTPVAARVAWALRVAEAVARAVAAIHAHGVVHGDIKPQNVVVGEGEEVALVDLGLARPPGRDDRVGGTPGYLSPEAWQGERSVATDVYALGATLHRLLGGSPLGAESRSHSVAEMVQRTLRRPPSASTLPGAVPVELCRLLDAMLDPEPTRRPSSVREVAARLAAIAGTGDRARQSGAADAATGPERAMAARALPLVGRDGPLEELVAALGARRFIAVCGPPGSGRSRLVLEAVRRHQRELTALGRAVPTYVRAEGALPDAVRRHDAVVHVVASEAVSASRIRSFVRAADVDGFRVTVVLEREAPDPAADVSVELPVLDRVALAPLLAAVLGRAPDEALLEAATAASGGLPGRLCRLCAEALDGGLDVSRPEVLATLGERPSPHSVAHEALPLAEALAVAGAVLPADRAVRSSGGGQAFERLVADGLASVTDDGALSLRPDVARRLRAQTPPDRAREHATELLAGPPLPVAARAFCEAALGRFDAAAGAFERAVAERRRAGDPEGAARLCRDALELGVEGPALRRAHADALRARGRYGEALEALEGQGDASAAALRAELHRLCGDAREARAQAEALESSPDEDAAIAASALLSRLDFDAGDRDRAQERASRALRAAAGRPALAAHAQEVRVLLALLDGDVDLAARRVAEGLELSSHDRGARARMRSLSATVALSRGEIRRAAEEHAEAFELAEAAGELHAAATFAVNVGLTRLDAGEPGPAVAALRDGARRLARLDRDRDLSRALYNLANAGLLVGDDDLARAAVERAGEAARRAGDEAALAYVAVVDSELRLRAGEVRKARAALAVEVPVGLRRERCVLAARGALAALVDGDVDAAAALVAHAGELASEVGADGAHLEHRVAAARLALAAGRVDEAVGHAAEAQARAERTGAFEDRLRAALVSADALEVGGDGEASRRRLSQARSLLDRAAATLPPGARARLRAVPGYQRALAAAPSAAALAAGADRRWRRLAELARGLSSEHRVGRLHERVVEAAVELSGAERGFLVARGDDGTLRVRATLRFSRGSLGGWWRGEAAAEPAATVGAADRVGEHALSRSVVARAIDGGRPVTTVDAMTDERLDQVASVHALSLRSILCVPLRLDGDVVGALYVDDRLRPAAFADEDVELLAALAELAAAALESAARLRAERRSARRLEGMRRRLARRVETQALEIASLRRASGDAELAHGVVARSEGMRRALELALRVAPSDASVLITGESGTGKELVARAIHRSGSRRDRPFITESCGAIPETLLESALFGHVRGAFTGADRSRVGLFEAADGGTLFLDEVGEMSAAMQTRLLRVVQEGELRPVGGERTRRVDVRLVTATHRDLSAMVERGEFREDLYYRLAVVVLSIPPLRERPEDVPPLVAHLLSRHAEGREVQVDRRALARLTAFRWPGNVRQLDNELRRALVLADDVIREEHLSPALVAADEDAPDELDLKAQVAALERRLIRRALTLHGGNQTRAARELGLSRYGLQKMIKRLDV